MKDIRLILTVPHGIITATSLGIEGFARHRSPGSGKHFQGRTIFIDLAITGNSPDFRFMDEGGWRDANGDTESALRSVAGGKRTKTAISNNGFSCTPISAYKSSYLVKTGGEVMKMEPLKLLHPFTNHACDEGLTTDQVAQAAGLTPPASRDPRIYMVLSPVQLVILSNLTPAEYAWYATHRPGKIFRQLLFTELHSEQLHLAAESRFESARAELVHKPEKKTKTIVLEECFNRVPFREWVGYRHDSPGGLYVADRDGVHLSSFPASIPLRWERAEG